jgi:hypothetical protein
VVHPSGLGTANYTRQFAGRVKGVSGLGTATFTIWFFENTNSPTFADWGYWTWGSGTASLTGIQGITTFKGTSPSATSPINDGTYISKLHF